jgi:two-component system KDP operon response regulator KdpE
MAKHLILVVDDDVPILRLVRAKLQADGYSVMTAGNGEDALSALEEERPDLVVLDLMMPGMDGFETMRRIREDSTIPIILLTARTGASDKIQGLDLGADDYVTKPFNPDELSSRIAAILRRTTGGTQPKNQVLRYDHLTINLEKRRVTIEDQEVHLSRTEWELLHQLASHTGRVMLHAELLTRIWGPEFRDETHYLRTWVSRLRKKLGDDQEPPTLITTFPGMGYRLEPPEEAG